MIMQIQIQQLVYQLCFIHHALCSQISCSQLKINGIGRLDIRQWIWCDFYSKNTKKDNLFLAFLQKGTDVLK